MDASRIVERWRDELRYGDLESELGRQDAEELRRVRRALDELEHALRKAGDGPAKLDGVSCWWLAHAGTGLPRGDVERAQAVWREVAARGGKGSALVAVSLLALVGSALHPADVPFWREVLAFTRPRDRSSADRQHVAVAALALLAAVRDEPAAWEGLLSTLEEGKDAARGRAARWTADALLARERPPSEAVEAALVRCATEDKALLPRFFARRALAALGREVPRDVLEGSYVFDVRPQRREDVLRRVEVASDSTLDDLHYAIQDAFRWDADHLYSFYVSGKAHDMETELSAPWEEQPEGPDYSTDVALGELGLRRGNRFLYLFDFGDDHRFSVRVVEVKESADRDRLPRVVEAVGRAPEQYSAW